MADFSFLDDMQVTGEDLSEMTLYSCILPNGKNPVLIGRHGGESTPAYANAILKGSVKQQKMVKAGMMTVGMLKQNRDQDRKLYPMHVITGWKDVCDGSKKPVKFSPEACTEFFAHLPDDIFDDVRDHYGNPRNFRNAVDPEAAADKGK